ncbi:ankyrin repeats (3 copies) domain-containing protein [Sarocladium implicatum]|nr:ankyrin repeats (3 copies) domain-containing protein [Sarocladium implicatum]
MESFMVIAPYNEGHQGVARSGQRARATPVNSERDSGLSPSIQDSEVPETSEKDSSKLVSAPEAHSNRATQEVAVTKPRTDDRRHTAKKSPRSRKGRRFPENSKSESQSKPMVASAQAKKDDVPVSIPRKGKNVRYPPDLTQTWNGDLKNSEEELRKVVSGDDYEAFDSFISRRGARRTARYTSGLPGLLLVVTHYRGSDALKWAARALEDTSLDIDAKDKTGRTALHIASQKGLSDVVTLLIENHARIDAGDKNGATALHLAVSEHHLSVVELLVKGDANLNAATVKEGQTPLHIAAYHGEADIMKVLLEARHINVSPQDYGRGLTPLHEACQRCVVDCDEQDDDKHTEAARLLVEAGANINATTLDNCTPLHLAVDAGRVAIVRILMTAGADPSGYTSGMANAESLAPAIARDEIIKVLRQKHKPLYSRPRLDTRYEIVQPRPDQESICKDFTAFIWPSTKPHEDPEYDVFSIWEMLYRPNPELKSEHEQTIWIHLPSNNRIWVEDVFKRLYDSGRLLQSPGPDGDGKKVLSHILQFIRSSFREIGRDKRSFQRSNFSVSEPLQTKPDCAKQRMTSLILPLIDVDMQQPEIYKPSVVEQNVELQIQKHLLETGQVPTQGSHLHNDNESLNNVRESETWDSCLVRALTCWAGTALTSQETTHVAKLRTLKKVYPIADHGRTLDESFHEHLEEEELNRRNGDQVVSRYAARAYLKHLKGSSLKSGVHQGEGADMQYYLSPMASRVDFNVGPPNANTLAATSTRNYQSSAPLTAHATNIPDLRQQVLVVQPLRMWKFENIVVTSYPERWTLRNQRKLPDILRNHVMNSHLVISQEHTEFDRAQRIMEEIVEVASQFEPKFAICSMERTYNNAFAGEIAHVSSKVTRCYSQYQDILGQVERDFAQAVQEETSYLVMIDDILDEISMIKRVRQSQEQVFSQIEQSREKQDSETLDGPWSSFRTPHRDQYNDLDRLEEDAKRVRKSVTTLLELRQRQASTENVVSLKEQSEILFQQSKILFIFTGATVVFAPLSWINSMMALKINHMTPKDERWERWQAFASSFTSLVGTLALCLVFWLWAESNSNSFFKTPQKRLELQRNSKRKESTSSTDEDKLALKTRSSWANNVGKTPLAGRGK